jgi:hypothetical protein
MDWVAPDIAKHTFARCLKKYPETFSGESDRVFVEEEVGTSLKSHIKNTSYATARAFDVGLVNTLTHKSWKVLINNSADLPFITGDEAVIVIPSEYLENIPLQNSFLALTHIFHLSPKIAIIASFPYSKSNHGELLFEDVSNNYQKIIEQNLLYVNHTHKYCYSATKKFFEMVINYETSTKVNI